MSDPRIQQRIKNRKPILKDTAYTICELADSLNLSIDTARKLIIQQKIRSKIVGIGRGTYRILGEWIIEYLKQID